MGYVEGLDRRFVDDGGAYGADARSGARGNAANAYDCGEDCRRAEAARLFQPLLGCEAGKIVAGNRYMEQRISVPERAAGGPWAGRPPGGPRAARRETVSARPAGRAGRACPPRKTPIP